MKYIITSLILIFTIFSSDAQMTVGDMVVGQGVSNPNAWQNYNVGAQHQGIFIDVNTSNCRFNTVPHYLVTLEGPTGYHWQVSGTPSIYNATATGFRVYLRWTDSPTDAATIGGIPFGNPLTAATAIDRQWVIRWTGIELGPCATCAVNSISERTTKDAFGDDIKGKNLNLDSQITPAVKGEFIIYPNPANSEIRIESTNSINKTEVYNLEGKLLLSSNNDVVDISTLVAASYIVRIYSGNEIVSKQFIKVE